MTEGKENTVRVVAETRICPECLGPGGKAVSHNAFRPEHNTAEGAWSSWFPPKDGARAGRRVPSADATSADPSHPWGNHCANIYRDHCTYQGDDENGYFRRKDQVVAVRGFMVDFDSHAPSDMPLTEIARIVESREFQDAVPCNRIVMTGHGYQVHFNLPSDIVGDEEQRAKQIAAYEAKITSVTAWLKGHQGLNPDPACKDITRLHRHCPSLNTKNMKSADDSANRIQVREVLVREVPAKVVAEFVEQACRNSPSVNAIRAVEVMEHTDTAVVNAGRMNRFLEAPCIKRIWDDGSDEGKRNADRFAVATRLKSCGYSQEEAEALVLEYNSRCHPPEEESAVRDHVARCYRDDKKSGCTYIRETCRACIYQDQPMEEAKLACPFWRRVSTAIDNPYYIGGRGNIMRKEIRILKEGNSEVVNIPVTETGYAVVTAVIREAGRQMYRGEIINGAWRLPFELDASLWVNRMKFGEVIKGLSGDKLIFTGRNTEHLALASERLQPIKEQLISAGFGWDPTFKAYFGVTCVIDKDGIHGPNELCFRAQHKAAKKLRLQAPESTAEIRRLLRHIKDDLMGFGSIEVMAFMLGTTFIAPFAGLFRERASTTNALPSIVVVGTTGKGKTALVVLCLCFFGQVRDGDVLSFSSTPRVLNDLGWWFKDALYLLDDMKWSSMSQSVQQQCLQVLQAYLDGHGRDRLANRGGGDWEPSMGREIRGTLCITAEDLPSGEASLFARCMIVHMERSVTDVALYSRCLHESRHYSKVMAAFLHWHLSQPDDPHGKLLADFDTYRRKFEEGVPREKINVIRVCSQLALNFLGYSRFIRFAHDNDVFTTNEVTRLLEAHETRLVALRDQRLTQISGETPAEKFLTMVSSLLQSGRVRLDDDEAGKGNVPVIGFMEYDSALGRNILYLDPQIAYGQVQRSYDDLKERIPFNGNSLGHQLSSQRYLAKKDADRLTYSKVRGGRKGRWYAIDVAKLGWETEPSPLPPVPEHDHRGGAAPGEPEETRTDEDPFPAGSGNAFDQPGFGDVDDEQQGGSHGQA